MSEGQIDETFEPLQELIELFLRGEATEQQHQQLINMMGKDEKILRQVYKEALMDSDLNCLFKKTNTEDLMRRVVKGCGAPQTRSHRRRAQSRSRKNIFTLFPLAIAALLMVGTSIAVVMNGFAEAPLLRIDSASGQAVYIIDQQGLRRAAAGDVIYEGYQISVAERSSAKLIYPDGTSLLCEPETILEFHTVNGSKLVRIDSGHLHAEVSKQPHGTSLTLRSQHADAVVIGTKFDLRVDEFSSKLEVTEGLVQFGNKQGDIRTLTAGHAAAVNQNGLIEDFKRVELYDAPYNWSLSIEQYMPKTWRCSTVAGEQTDTFALHSVERQRNEHYGIVSGDRWYNPPFKINKDSIIRMRVKLERNGFWHMFLLVQEQAGRAPSINFELHPKMPSQYKAGEWVTVEVAVNSGKRPSIEGEDATIASISDFFCWRFFLDSQSKDLGLVIGSFEIINSGQK